MSAPADSRDASAPPQVTVIGQTTTRDAQDGISAARQRAAIYLLAYGDPEKADAAKAKLDALGRERGWLVVARYYESDLKARQKLRRLLRRAQTKAFDLVLVADFDDFGRSRVAAARVIVRLGECGVRVMDADGRQPQPQDQALRWIVLGERRRARRIRGTLKAKKRRGEVTGPPPYGWRVAADGVHLEPDPAEQATIDQVRALAKQGLSATAIARMLSDAGVTSRAGTPITHKQVQRLLARA